MDSNYDDINKLSVGIYNGPLNIHNDQKHFIVKKKFIFRCDSTQQRDEWINAIINDNKNINNTNNYKNVYYNNTNDNKKMKNKSIKNNEKNEKEEEEEKFGVGLDEDEVQEEDEKKKMKNWINLKK